MMSHSPAVLPSAALQSSVLEPGGPGPQVELVAAIMNNYWITVAAELDRWAITSGDRQGTALFSDHWFVIDFPPGRGRPRRPVRLVAQNTQLPGNAKHVLHDGSVRIRAEIPLDEPGVQDSDELEALVRQSVVGVSLALAADRKSDRTDVPPGARLDLSVDSPVTEQRVSLAELCTDAGWSFSERSEDRISVDLDVAENSYYKASVDHGPESIRISVNPNRGDPATETISHQAIAALMLSVSGAVRMVSAISSRSTGKPGKSHDTFFRIVLPSTTSSSTFAHSLSALSVACEICGAEVRALAEDPGLARAFLEVCHPRALPSAKQGKLPMQAATHEEVDSVTGRAIAP